MTDTFDALFAIAEKSQLLDKVETTLRAQNKNFLADTLFKFQQDVSIEIDRFMHGETTKDAEPGEQTQDLKTQFEPVDFMRINLLFKAIDQQITAPVLKKKLAGLIKDITPPVSDVEPTPKTSPAPNKPNKMG